MDVIELTVGQHPATSGPSWSRHEGHGCDRHHRDHQKSFHTVSSLKL
jgi:hypothetical protein